MITGIIYMATNQENGKAYIGQTTRTLEERQAEHLYTSDRIDLSFYRAIHKYGWKAFHWEVLAEIKKPEDYIKRHLNYWERRFIDMYDTYIKGYNMTKGGDGTLGITMSAAAVEKSQTKGLATKRNNRKSFLTEEQKEQLPAIKLTDHQRRVLDLYLKGCSQSEIADMLEMHQTSVHKCLFGCIDYKYKKTYGGIARKLQKNGITISRKKQQLQQETQ